MKILWVLYLLVILSSPSYSSEIKPVIAVYPAWQHDTDSIKFIPWARYSHLAIAGVYPKDDGSLIGK
jgi:hypothetical protein